MLSTYQGRKIALGGILTFFCCIIGIQGTVESVDVDKEIVQVVILEEVSLESVKEEEVIEEVKEEPEEVVEESTYPKFYYSKDWDDEDSYLLAKIAMAEAEGESIQLKELVVMTVLNRVYGDEFPDTIEEVIFQERNGVYQFSPIGDGRWDRVEPNEECWEAVRNVQEAIYDYSERATFFESCKSKDTWHSRNLEFLYEVDGMRFYR